MKLILNIEKKALIAIFALVVIMGSMGVASAGLLEWLGFESNNQSPVTGHATTNTGAELSENASKLGVTAYHTYICNETSKGTADKCISYKSISENLGKSPWKTNNENSISYNGSIEAWSLNVGDVKGDTTFRGNLKVGANENNPNAIIKNSGDAEFKEVRAGNLTIKKYYVTNNSWTSSYLNNSPVISTPSNDGEKDLAIFGSGSNSKLNLRLYDGSLKVGTNENNPNAIIKNSGDAEFKKINSPHLLFDDNIAIGKFDSAWNLSVKSEDNGVFGFYGQSGKTLDVDIEDGNLFVGSSGTGGSITANGDLTVGNAKITNKGNATFKDLYVKGNPVVTFKKGTAGRTCTSTCGDSGSGCLMRIIPAANKDQVDDCGSTDDGGDNSNEIRCLCYN